MSKIEKITVVGGGYMGGGIAQVFAKAGFSVRVADKDEMTAKSAVSRLVNESKQFENQGIFEKGATEKIIANLHYGSTIEDAVKDADLIIEAVFEDIKVKSSVLRRISESCPKDAVIGTNTSTISVNLLKDYVSYPERFMTVHFFNPAPLIPGVEMVVSSETDTKYVEPVKKALEASGKRPAAVNDTPGMVINRIQYAMVKEAFRVVDEGIASMADVDTLVRNSLGFRLGIFGPFAILDQAGVDVYQSCFKILENSFGDRMSCPESLNQAVQDGIKGMKNERGLLGEYTPEVSDAVVEYRSLGYSRMKNLQDSLGEPPHAL